MAISFKNLKSPVLGLTDKITVGKLSGCRVCDVIPDYYEYLIWADKAGLLKFQKIVVETIQEHAGYKNQQRHYDEEVAPYVTGGKYEYLAEIASRQDYDTTFEEGDIPF
jgi:hypothetical protein